MSKRAKPVRFAVLWATAVGCLAYAAASEDPEPSFSARFSLDYVPRWGDVAGDSDQDVYASTLLDWGKSTDRVSGSFFWRGVKDVDGPAAPKDDPFHSVYDAYGDEWFSQLFHAYVDLRGDGVIGLGRVGRQFLYEGQPFHFDGARFDTRAGPSGLQASLFGGVPVHYFEDSREGDWLLGLGVEARPWVGGKVGLLYAHVEDDGHFAGLEETSEADDMFLVSAAGRLGDWGTALVRYTVVDAATRDLIARFRGAYERSDLSLSLAYYLQPETLAVFSTDLSPYQLVMGDSYPFQRLDLAVAKGFAAGGWRVELETLWATRSLLDPSDEGEYNRNYDMLRFGLGAGSGKPKKLSAGGGVSWWWSSGDRFEAFDAEIRYEPTEALRLGVGTSYTLYSYDIFSLSEKTDVREAHLKVRWKSSGKSRLRFKYAAEWDDAGLIQTLRLGWSRSF